MNAQFDRRIHGTTDWHDKSVYDERRAPLNGWRLAFWLLAIVVVIWSVM